MFISLNSLGQQDRADLKKTIKTIASRHPAKIGFAVIDLQSGDTIDFNGKAHFPMQSAYKFHLALAVLKQVDEGKLKLDQQIFVTAKDLLPNPWSPMREKYPHGNVSITLAEILSYSVSQSDNNGCDMLFRLIGGSSAVHQFIHSVGIQDVARVATEEEMHMNQKIQFKNWSTSFSAVQLLKLFYDNKMLSKSSGDLLLDIMMKTISGPNKIKGLLPKVTIVAYKMDSSGTNSAGVTVASNDIGIVSLPDGKNFAIAVFVSMTNEEEKVTDQIIPEFTKGAWNYFLKEDTLSFQRNVINQQSDSIDLLL
ncbi:class A beta-lactamase, subclass A2 [Pedobacter sp. N36a]|uniref:class A beta-lactamase, subclass A2 n=1 Tax=Pedobacter sp. N36a TaxID=2767996 RepID=UPI0016573024|nr:class A beta-lactamase, subclass A2 [Pedobacter sp. N36a]MBC8986313.1 class A beta-lactamase, subclass A2 [Pedobacter sp. N36a]